MQWLERLWSYKSYFILSPASWTSVLENKTMIWRLSVKTNGEQRSIFRNKIHITKIGFLSVIAPEGSWGFKRDKWDLQTDGQKNFTLRWKNKLAVKHYNSINHRSWENRNTYKSMNNKCTIFVTQEFLCLFGFLVWHTWWTQWKHFAKQCKHRNVHGNLIPAVFSVSWWT